MSETNTRIVLASRPSGRPTAQDFRIETAPMPVPGVGEVLLKVLYLSLDPYMRGRMSEAKSYAPPVAVGDVMPGGTVAQVVQGSADGFAVGDIVLAYCGWQQYAVAQTDGLRKLDPSQAPVTTALGVLGMPGFTAYSGLLTIGRPAKGETVVVAAASGPVGSAVGQIARLKGARAVGIAGGPEKCRYIQKEFGFDAVIDHRAPDFPRQLANACPDGIDVYFENVGGAVWDAVFPLLNPFARVPVCGLVAQYNGAPGAQGAPDIAQTMRQVLSRSLTIRGFIQREFIDQQPAFAREMGQWVTQGKVRYKEDIVAGLEQAPEAFIGLLDGKNFGKLVIEVAQATGKGA